LRRLAPGRSVLCWTLLRSVPALVAAPAAWRLRKLRRVASRASATCSLATRNSRNLRIDSRLTLPGVWELGRSAPAAKLSRPRREGSVPVEEHSPISWSDSGNLKVVRRVPGGTVDPGKVLAGLARAAESTGAPDCSARRGSRTELLESAPACAYAANSVAASKRRKSAPGKCSSLPMLFP